MGNNELETYSQGEESGPNQGTFPIFGVEELDNIFPAWFQNYCGPVTDASHFPPF